MFPILSPLLKTELFGPLDVEYIPKESFHYHFNVFMLVVIFEYVCLCVTFLLNFICILRNSIIYILYLF